MASRNFSITIEKGKDGYYVVQCVEIPEAISQGKTKPEALKKIKEAIGVVFELRGKERRSKNEASN